MDMPVPAVAEWEWLNWKFPRPVRAGETIYARWTLTQKRPAVGGAPTAIVVWRVDVHTTGGALCAEGDVGASVMRKVTGTPKARVEEAGTPAAGTAAPRRRRRRRTAAGDGAKSASETKAALAAEAPSVATPAPAAASERAASGTRRRRRRRSPGSGQARNGDTPAPAAPLEASSSPDAERSLPSAPAPREEPSSPPGGDEAANPLSRVIRRLRRP